MASPEEPPAGLGGPNSPRGASFRGVDPQRLSEMLSSSTISHSLTNADILQAFPALWDTPFIPKSQLIFVRQIGQGSFGRVFKGIVYEQDVAIKELTVRNVVDTLGECPPDPAPESEGCPCRDCDASTIARNLLALEKEVSILRTLRFMKVVMFLGVCLDPPCIVTEYCARGSLLDVLAKAKERPDVNGKRLTWRRRLGMALDAAKGMNYLHSHIPPVEHRDLKSPNLLVDEHWNVKVADFNTSRFIDPIIVTASVCANNPRWLAPEVLEKNLHTTASDVYPFGIIMWELLTWEQPWERDNVNTFQILQFVLRDDLRPQIPPKDQLPGDACPDELYDDYVALMTECWDRDPAKRPKFHDVVQRLTTMKEKLVMIVKSESCAQENIRALAPTPPPVHMREPPRSPRLEAHTKTPFASGPFAEGPPRPPGPPPVGLHSIPKHLDTEDAEIAARLQRSASLGQRYWRSLRELFASERKVEGQSEKWKAIMQLLADAPSAPSDLEQQVGPSISLGDRELPYVPKPDEGPTKLRAGSKWKVLQNVLGDGERRGMHKGWQVVREVLQSEGSGVSEQAVQEAVEESQQQRAPPGQMKEGHPAASQAKARKKKSGKWGIVKNLMLTEDTYPAHPGWDFLRWIVELNPTGMGAAGSCPAPSSQLEGGADVAASGDLDQGGKPLEGAVKGGECKVKRSKRWGELRDVLLGEMDEVPKVEQMMHPGWQVVQEVFGVEDESREVPTLSVGDEPAADSPPPAPTTPPIEEVSAAPSLSTGMGHHPKHPGPPRVGELPQPPAGATNWDFLRQLLKSEESSMLVNHWDFLEDLVKERMSSSGSLDEDTASSQRGESTELTDRVPAGRKLVKKRGMSKHWKKVKDLLIVDTDPPSPEKWRFLKEWLTGDDDLGPEWHELRDFASRMDGVPEGASWNIFRTLFFEDVKIRSHPHWSFLKDLMVKDAHPNKKLMKGASSAFKTDQVKQLFKDPGKPINESQWGALRTLMMNNPEEGMDELREYAMENERPPVRSNWDDILQVLAAGK
ncbi:unnamed protein product [Ostreobium quekettii]|uniref:Protein kinase domain-containing protein n=1 Tax=Ostreobium quekettii TaxID=121088 RepID=A0A8S1IQJ4_9CHLO|nr:unnamed protein product [Ostreobium quekettii]|eukprot:evm.model.scf_2006.2 EVM.evm.TU.scf_2006.2   scf_2006:18242-22694(+)